MKLLLIWCVVFSFISASFGQNKIDSLLTGVTQEKLTKNEQLKLLLHYHLPTWSYQRILTEAQGSINNSGKSGDSRYETLSRRYFKFKPEYQYYYGSDPLIYFFKAYVIANHNYNKSRSTANDETNERINANNQVELNAGGYFYRYFKKNLFFKTKDNVRFQYGESDYKHKKSNGYLYRNNSLRRHYDFTGNAGIGIGRIRNVTPVIRAVSFANRFNAIRKEHLSAKEIMALSRYFTERGTFNLIYDRPDKYFYQAFPSSIAAKLSDITAWEAMYLNDSFTELIGNRYEGYEISTGFNLDYDRDDFVEKRNNKSENSLLGLYLSGSFYHNPTPAYQYGIKLFTSYLQNFTKASKFKNLGTGLLSFSNLLNLTDRLLCQIELGYRIDFWKNSLAQPFKKMTQNECFVNSNFEYYIENNFVFNIYLSYQKIHSSENYILSSAHYLRSSNNGMNELRLHFGLRYYFVRDLY